MDSAPLHNPPVVQNPVHLLRHDPRRKRIQRIVRATPRSKTIRETEKVLLVNPIENFGHCLLHDFVFQRRDPERTLPPIRFRDVNSP
jgi:hypothetical protein